MVYVQENRSSVKNEWLGRYTSISRINLIRTSNFILLYRQNWFYFCHIDRNSTYCIQDLHRDVDIRLQERSPSFDCKGLTTRSSGETLVPRQEFSSTLSSQELRPTASWHHSLPDFKLQFLSSAKPPCYFSLLMSYVVLSTPHLILHTYS